MWVVCASFLFMSDGGQLESFFANLMRRQAREAGAEDTMRWLEGFPQYAEPSRNPLGFLGDVLMREAGAREDAGRAAFDAFMTAERAIEGASANALRGRYAEPGSMPYDWDLTLPEVYREMGAPGPIADVVGTVQSLGLPSTLDAVPGLSTVSDIAEIVGDAGRLASRLPPGAVDATTSAVFGGAGMGNLGDRRTEGEVGNLLNRLFGREVSPEGPRVEGRRFVDEPIIEGAPLHVVRTGPDEVAYRELQAGKEPGRRSFSEPVPVARDLARSYKEQNSALLDYDINDVDEGIITALDVDHQKRIAEAFENAVDSPNDPMVQTAYTQLATETMDQYNWIVNNSDIRFELWDKGGEPYANSAEMLADVRENGHMYVLATEAEFGAEGISDAQRAGNPLLQDSGITDVNGRPMLINDVFRGVHDFFGHSVRGNSFGAVGEENAWAEHAAMFSPLARRAMTTETRGQNSWVNFGPNMQGPDGRVLKPGDEGYMSSAERGFAEQKMTLLPEWVSDPFLIGRENPAGNLEGPAPETPLFVDEANPEFVIPKPVMDVLAKTGLTPSGARRLLTARAAENEPFNATLVNNFLSDAFNNGIITYDEFQNAVDDLGVFASSMGNDAYRGDISVYNQMLNESPEESLKASQNLFSQMPRELSDDATGSDLYGYAADNELFILDALRNNPRITPEEADKLREFEDLYLDYIYSFDDTLNVRTADGRVINPDYDDENEHLDLIHSTLGTKLGNDYLEAIGFEGFRFTDDYVPKTDIGQNVGSLKAAMNQNYENMAEDLTEYTRQQRMENAPPDEFEQELNEMLNDNVLINFNTMMEDLFNRHPDLRPTINSGASIEEIADVIENYLDDVADYGSMANFFRYFREELVSGEDFNSLDKTPGDFRKFVRENLNNIIDNVRNNRPSGQTPNQGGFIEEGPDNLEEWDFDRINQEGYRAVIDDAVQTFKTADMNSAYGGAIVLDSLEELRGYNPDEVTRALSEFAFAQNPDIDDFEAELVANQIGAALNNEMGAVVDAMQRGELYEIVQILADNGVPYDRANQFQVFLFGLRDEDFDGLLNIMESVRWN